MKGTAPVTTTPRLLVAAAIATPAAAALLIPATAASADAALISSSPAAGETVATAPETVELTFNGDLIPDAFSVLIVTDADGNTVSTGDATVDGPVLSTAVDATEEGQYDAVWQTVSDDDHTVDRAFRFGVGEPSTPTTAASAY